MGRQMTMGVIVGNRGFFPSHLAESGHPLVGERVYIRDYARRGVEPIEVTRLLLHAARLEFEHPVDGRPMGIDAGLDETWLRLLERFGWSDAYAAQVQAWKTVG